MTETPISNALMARPAGGAEELVATEAAIVPAQLPAVASPAAYEGGPLALFERMAHWVRSRRGLARYALAGGLGLAAAAAQAPIFAVPTLVFAFTGLVWLLDATDAGPKGLRQAAGIGWAFGFGTFLAGLYWIGYAFLVDAETFAWAIPFVALLMPSGLALFTALATVLARAAWVEGPARVLVLALAWTAGEWLRGHALTGFPWNLTGNVWVGVPAVMQIAAITGAYGLGLLTVVWAALPAGLLACGEGRIRAGRGHAFLFVGAYGLLALIALGGAARLLERPAVFHPDLSVRIVQPSVEQAGKWDPENRRPIWEQLLALTGDPGKEREIVIWPEAAAPVVLSRDEAALAQLGRQLGPARLLVAGANRAEGAWGTEEFKVFNSVHLLNSDGSILGSYDKHHLVPFGEYLPAADLLETLGLEKLTGGLGSFASGPGARTLFLPDLPSVGPLICYEVIFPGQVTDAARRPDWLVNLTDDSWFGDSSGPRQHLAIARMRAVEEGLPIVRAANNGISAVIDPYGRVGARLALNEVGVLRAGLPKPLSPTLYALFGDAMLLLLMGAGLWLTRLNLLRAAP